MKTNVLNQEILLMTTTTFSQKQWCQKDRLNSNNNASPAEHLEEACWNGLLNELFPDLIKQSHHHPLFLWQVRCFECCIDIELGEYHTNPVNQFSIDPYHFIETIIYS